jgi:NAD(P)-dependent dehydrogenase (short-subunit alcohol dehydrogenase family)
MNQKVCAIVGFGTGVSMGVANVFGKAGYTLALLARNPNKLAENVSVLEEMGITAHPFVADAGDEASLVTAFTQVRQQLGDPSVLIYNAAILKLDAIADLTSVDLVRDFQINITGAIVSIQQVLPAMRQQQQGTILLTGGGLALYPNPSLISLGIGKAGIRNLAFSLAQDLGSSGIHVGTVTICGTVAPGTHFDPDAIAQSYLALHQQAPADWQTEIVYQ